MKNSSAAISCTHTIIPLNDCNKNNAIDILFFILLSFVSYFLNKKNDINSTYLLIII